MKTFGYFIVFLIILLNIEQKVHAQSIFTNIFKENRQFVGVQINPYFFYLGDITYHRYNSKVIGFRYGMELYKNVSFGPEFSNLNYKYISDGSRATETRIGLFARYGLLGEKNVQILIEPGLYYQIGRYHSFMMADPDWSKNKFGWYASAGMGINLYKKKVTLDLMVKYSPDLLFEGSHFAPTYKLNYHFKFK